MNPKKKKKKTYRSLKIVYVDTVSNFINIKKGYYKPWNLIELSMEGKFFMFLTKTIETLKNFNSDKIEISPKVQRDVWS